MSAPAPLGWQTIGRQPAGERGLGFRAQGKPKRYTACREGVGGGGVGWGGREGERQAPSGLVRPVGSPRPTYPPPSGPPIRPSSTHPPPTYLPPSGPPTPPPPSTHLGGAPLQVEPHLLGHQPHLSAPDGPPIHPSSTHLGGPPLQVEPHLLRHQHHLSAPQWPTHPPLQHPPGRPSTPG